MKTKTLLAKLAKRFPKRYAKANRDYVGLMAGKPPLEVNKILLCLDFDEFVLPIAIKEKPDLILTHHPFIYGQKAKVLKYDETKKALYNKIIKNDLTIYSMHTNFDTGNGGMNDALSEQLGLDKVYIPQKDIMMRIGELKNEMNIIEFARMVKRSLGIDYALLINKGKQQVKKVAIIGGGGSRSWPIAKEEGADIYISGDVTHHVRRDIVCNGYNYLDVPHEIERVFMPQMKKIIHAMDDNIEVLIVDHEETPKII